jgi:hypothetical protein
MSPEFNFISPRISTKDIDLFLGPLEPKDGPFIWIEANWTMAHVLHTAGLFPSVKQAKNNGWDKPIPIGYSEYTVTKRKVKIFILTQFD